MMTIRRFPFLLAVLCIAISSYPVVAKNDNNDRCPNECEPNGECVNGECQCNDGFAGADCSFPFQQCPDLKTMCFDGAQCQRIAMKDDGGGRINGYQCDCSNIPNASPFQIAECQNPESHVCEEGQPTSDYAFCTNGGRCKEMIVAGAPHAGCICPNEFEGRHCQYRKGTAPDAELKVAYEEKRSHISGGLMFVSLLVIFGVIGLAGYVYYTERRQKQYDSQEKHTKIESFVRDLAVTKSEDEADKEYDLELRGKNYKDSIDGKNENDGDDDESIIVEVIGGTAGEMA